MSRHNRLIELVFNDIIANQDKISSIEKFLSTDDALNIIETEILKQFKDSYKKIVDDISDSIDKLARLEELIVQLRCIAMVHEEIKFSQVREYIYARTLFYRSGKEIKDIRVLIGRLDDFDEPYEDLIQDPDFVILAEGKLQEAMYKEINQLMKISNIVENLQEESLVDSE